MRQMQERLKISDVCSQEFSVPEKTWVSVPALLIPKQMAMFKLFYFIGVRLAY